jgi:hypothetical protein
MGDMAPANLQLGELPQELIEALQASEQIEWYAWFDDDSRPNTILTRYQETSARIRSEQQVFFLLME